MYPKSFRTIEEAFGLVRDYNLQHADLGGGSAEGLVAFLFLPGDTIWSVYDLSKRIAEYRNGVAEASKHGRDFDVQLAQEVSELLHVLHERDEQRQKLVAWIRKVKFGPEGGATWSAISQLATTLREAREAIYVTTGVPSYRVEEVVAEVERHSSFLGPWIGYEPGQDPDLDTLVRIDIERLDSILEHMEPWDGKEEQSSYEIEALMSLVRQASSQ